MLRNAIGIVATAALALSGALAQAEVFQFAFTGEVTFEQVLVNGQVSFQGPHTGMKVSGTFRFDPALAPQSAESLHNIIHDAGTSAADFVTAQLQFENGDTFTPALLQAASSSLDSTEVQDEDSSSTDTVYFRDGGSHNTAGGAVTDEQTYLEVFVSESDPNIHDLVTGALYGQTPNQTLVAQFGTGKYFHLVVVPGEQPDTFVATEDTFGEFKLTSLTFIPEPSSCVVFVVGLVLLAAGAYRRMLGAAGSAPVGSRTTSSRSTRF